MKTRYYQSLTKSNSFSFVKDKFSFHLVFFGVERGGDASRLAQGCKSRILVSLRTFWAKHHHIQTSRSRLGLDAKKYKKYIYCLCFNMVSFRGKKKSLGHAQIGLLQGFNSKFSTSSSTPFICGVPLPGFWPNQKSCK